MTQHIHFKITSLFNKIVSKVKSFAIKSTFRGSSDYWNERYLSGGNSGPGSYNKLAEFKAAVLNDFVKNNGINTVIEWGCGDGNQLSLATYPFYLGIDVSEQAIAMCINKFENDDSKRFTTVINYAGDKAELAISLDVIYHLIEDDLFQSYMISLFDSAKSFVIVYSSDKEEEINSKYSHVRHRQFTNWVNHNIKDWELINSIPNKYPFNDNIQEGSFADFYIYKKLSNNKLNDIT